MKQAIESIVAFLKKTAGNEDMASVQINNEGKIILRTGVSHTEHLSVDELIAMMEQEK